MVVHQRKTRRCFRRHSCPSVGTVINDAYPDSRPTSVGDVVRDVAHLFDDYPATPFRQTHDDDGQVFEQSWTCFDRWHKCVEAFCSVPVEYDHLYDHYCRTCSVLVHQALPYLIVEFFDSNTDARADDGRRSRVDDSELMGRERFRPRIRQRYAETFQTLIVDEVQDVSVAQHAAFARLVPSRTSQSIRLSRGSTDSNDHRHKQG